MNASPGFLRKDALALTAIALSTFAAGAAAVAAGTSAPRSPAPPGPNQSRLTSGYGEVPLSFEANQGQTDKSVLYLSRGAGYGLFLSANEAVLALEQSTVRLNFVGADPRARVVGEAALPGKSHYLRGGDPTRWTKNIPNFGRVRVRNAYPGVDLLYYGVAQGRERRLEYDFVVAPGVDPDVIRVQLEGAEPVKVQPDGDLVLHTASGDIRQHAPVAYQERNGRRSAVAARYAVEDGERVSFKLGAYDRALPLVIDPVLQYSTYLGGNLNDVAEAIAVDDSGSAFIAGTTFSPDFPTRNAVGPEHSGFRDVFISKLSPNGKHLLFSTFLGGVNDDSAVDLALDPQGNPVVTGITGSPDFPVANALQPEISDAVDKDAFLTKLSADGSTLIFSTYLGAVGDDAAGPVAVGDDSSIYLAVSHSEPVPPPPGSSVSAPALPQTPGAFILKLNTAASALLYTYVLPSTGVATLSVHPDGAVAFGGSTDNPDLPTSPGAYQEEDPDAVRGMDGSVISNKSDAFAAKLNPAGTALEYATYLGGSQHDEVTGAALDGDGNVYLAGGTESANLPLANAHQSEIRGIVDGFLVKLSPDYSELVYGTFYGGRFTENVTGLAVDGAGNATIVGYTASANLAMRRPVQGRKSASPNNESHEVFVAQFNEDGALAFGTYLGGRGEEEASDVAVDTEGSIYVAGVTNSPDFPRANPLQISKRGRIDSFVSKIRLEPLARAPLAANPVRLRFAVTRIGSQRTLRLRVQNKSRNSVSGNVPALAAPFSIEAGGGAFELGPGETRSLTVRFAPTAVGVYQTALSISSGEGAPPTVVPIQGSAR